MYGPTEYPYYPNLQSTTIGVGLMYLPQGQRYSMRAMINQQEWQVKSAGSLMYGGAVFAHFVSNRDSSVIPTNLQYRDFLDSTHLRHINSYGITGNGGYGYNLVVKRHWFVSLSGDLGVGLAYSETKDMRNDYRDKFGFLLNTNARFGAGYNSAKWFVGFYTIYRTDIIPLPFDRSLINLSEGMFRLQVARRIFVGRQSWFSN